MKLPSKEKCLELAEKVGIKPSFCMYASDIETMIRSAYKEGAEARSREILFECAEHRNKTPSVIADTAIARIELMIRHLKGQP